MDRLIDAAAVLLFAGATAFVALYARGWFAGDTAGHAPIAAPAAGLPAPSAPPSYAVRVATVVPKLEAQVAAGSMRDRALVCDESARLAEIAAIEQSIGPAGDPAIATPLAEGIAALKECVACTPEPRGCADAARAFSKVEAALALPRSAGGI